MVFLPFLKFLIAHSATQALRERSLVENCLACARISSKYFGSTTLSYSRKVLSAGSSVPDSDIMDKSGPLAYHSDAINVILLEVKHERWALWTHGESQTIWQVESRALRWNEPSIGTGLGGGRAHGSDCLLFAFLCRIFSPNKRPKRRRGFLRCVGNLQILGESQCWKNPVGIANCLRSYTCSL